MLCYRYMNDLQYIPVLGNQLHSYLFPVDLRQETDGRWSARIDALPDCATVADTKKEAFHHIRNTAHAYLHEMKRLGMQIPAAPTVQVLDDLVVTVTVEDRTVL